MKAKWLIDTRVERDYSEGRLAAAVRAAGLECFETKYVPFSDDPGPLPVVYRADEPVVVHGCRQFVEKVRPRGFLGVYDDGEPFRYSMYSRKLRSHMLNASFVKCPWGFYKQVGRKEHFVRPDAGAKAFTGQVMSANGEERVRQIAAIDAQPDVTNDMKVIVAAPRHIDAEFRFVIAAKQPVAGSCYRWHGKLDVRPDYDPEAWATAAAVASADWQPDDVYVCDVAWISGFGCRVVELNAFSCSGLYLCAHDKIVDAVSWVTERRYNLNAATIAGSATGRP